MVLEQSNIICNKKERMKEIRLKSYAYYKNKVKMDHMPNYKMEKVLEDNIENLGA